MANKKKQLRKRQIRDFIIKREGFIIDIRDRGEYAIYEDEFCYATFERNNDSQIHTTYIAHDLNVDVKVITPIYRRLREAVYHVCELEGGLLKGDFELELCKTYFVPLSRDFEIASPDVFKRN